MVASNRRWVFAFWVCLFTVGLRLSGGLAYADEWTLSTSEEQGESSPAVCSSGFANGVRCQGRYCDNISFKCGKAVAKDGGQWSSYFSEEEPHEQVCPSGQFVDGVRCKGRYCDSMSVHCAKGPELQEKSCFWTAKLSEENGGAQDFGKDSYLRGLRCNGRYCDEVQGLVCMTEEPECTSSECKAEQAKKFAPLLRFDQEQGNTEKCFPSDAGTYYNARKSGSKERICNTDVNSIDGGHVPIYYAYQNCSSDSTVIMYWFFYGYQDTCTGSMGSHNADWERIAVKIRNGRLERVLFFQHSGSYTRNPDTMNFVDGNHPVVYVGKNAHGSFHDDGGSGSCLYFEDYRNPGGKDQRLESWNNLVELRDDANAPEWMRAKSAEFFDGIPGPLARGINLCSLPGCAGKDFKVGALCTGQCGCSKSSIGDLPF